MTDQPQDGGRWWGIDRPPEPSQPAAPEPAAPEPAAPEPAAPRSYELPGARRVVTAGIHLALTSTRDLRWASIYIGLLVLGALGPAVVFTITAIDAFEIDLAALFGPVDSEVPPFVPGPDFVGPLLTLSALVTLGAVLVIAISIDAQAIAIAILGGRAAGRPLALAEAITRARQVFWRLLAGSMLVGLYTSVVQYAAGAVLGTPDQFSTDPTAINPALDFIVAMLATLATIPFAYVATGIVLGDVGAFEALRRSVRLFRARPVVALVVVLFTLVTAAIQIFAFGAGLELVLYAADVLDLDITAGGLGLIAPAILALAVVTAFGSLLFTISALVSAPQVAAFLGLTFYDAGLDRSRAEGGRPTRFRWIGRPMLASFLGLALVCGLGIPPMVSREPIANGPTFELLEASAERAGWTAVSWTPVTHVDDPADDLVSGADPAADILAAEYALLDVVPEWLLDDLFSCRASGVSCASDGSPDGSFDEGAFIVLQRMAAPPGELQGSARGDWGPVFALEGYDTAPGGSGRLYGSASHALLTHHEAGLHDTRYYEFDGGTFNEYLGDFRSAWIGSDLVTLIPTWELPGWPLQWDIHALYRGDDGATSRDNLRPFGGALREFWDYAVISLYDPAATIVP
jgi:hypothetical protein